MSTKTTTKVAHYYVQKQRRAEFIDSWRENHRTVVALEDVDMQDTNRRMRRGVYVGADGGRPRVPWTPPPTRSTRAQSARCTATPGTP
jgi:gentisate 1,2-dioxygenase